MPREQFKHVESWVFDLDNTLYPPEIRLFDQIERRMTRYVMKALDVDMDEANTLRHRYWKSHGTTLAGLMENHDLDPHPYLADVHDIDLSGIPEAPDLRTAVADLPGRKIVFTNGSREHARRITEARGLSGVFDALYGIEDAGFTPKPEQPAFDRVFSTDGLRPAAAAMFEDEPRNLISPHRMGMQTILVGAADPSEHIHHQTSDLTGFLRRIV